MQKNVASADFPLQSAILCSASCMATSEADFFSFSAQVNSCLGHRLLEFYQRCARRTSAGLARPVLLYHVPCMYQYSAVD